LAGVLAEAHASVNPMSVADAFHRITTALDQTGVASILLQYSVNREYRMIAASS